jgi:CHASE3 domain sensor protein
MAGLVVLLGCGNQEEPTKAKKPVSAGHVKKEIKGAAEAIKEYTLQQKEEYQKRLEAQLKEMHQKIADLQTKAAKAAPEAKANLQEQANEIQKKWEATEEKLTELEKATGKAWEDLKSGMGAAMDDLQKSYDKASSHFK